MRFVPVEARLWVDDVKRLWLIGSYGKPIECEHFIFCTKRMGDLNFSWLCIDNDNEQRIDHYEIHISCGQRLHCPNGIFSVSRS